MTLKKKNTVRNTGKVKQHGQIKKCIKNIFICGDNQQCNALLRQSRTGNPEGLRHSSWNQSPSAIYRYAPSFFVFISVLSRYSPPRGSKSHLLCCLGL
jgi:hypothetical protein